MKPTILILALLLTPSLASAQDFSFRRETRFWYYESVPYSDYGYRPYFPMRRWQQYPIQQQFYPMNWGSIPGAVSNGYFIPNYYGW